MKTKIITDFILTFKNNQSFTGVEYPLLVLLIEHIGISPLTNKRVQPRKDSVVSHHLLNCNYIPTFEDFSVLCH